MVDRYCDRQWRFTASLDRLREIDFSAFSLAQIGKRCRGLFRAIHESFTLLFANPHPLFILFRWDDSASG